MTLKIKKMIDKVRSISLMLKTLIQNAVNGILRLLTILVLTVGFMYVSARAPEIHGYWLRSYVGSKVFLVKDSMNSGGGTGFAVKAHSGATYIITNDHVCEVSTDKKTVLVQDDEGLYIRRRIIARSDFSDLCLIEGVPGVEGLSIGSEPMIGQIIAAVGHPSLMPITLTRGEIIGQEDIPIPVGPIAILNPSTNKLEQVPPENGGVLPADCQKPKNLQVEGKMSFIIFEIPAVMCINLTKAAYRTNMQIQPGSSGSPIVNFFGQVVGVIFAGDRAMWAAAVSHDDLVNFLKSY